MEAFAIATGALQCADAGLKLAKALYDYQDTVRNADKHLKAIALEVKVTSSTLAHLGQLLKDGEAEQHCSTTLIEDAHSVFQGCKDAFGEVHCTYKAVVKPNPDGTQSNARWVWPFKKAKLEVLQANLERLKTTLLLMLSVLSFAQEKARNNANESRLAQERLHIQNLIQAQSATTERYHNLVAAFTFRRTTDPTWASEVDPLGRDHVIEQLSMCTFAVSGLALVLKTAIESRQSSGTFDFASVRSSFSEVSRAFDALQTVRGREIAMSPQYSADTDLNLASTPVNDSLGSGYALPVNTPQTPTAPIGKTPLSFPGPILSNVHSPGAQQGIPGGVPLHVVPGFNSARVAHLSQCPQAAPQTDQTFRCDQCPQTFNRNHDLRRHKRIHLAMKPLPCGHCEKRFSRKDALKRHELFRGCGKANDATEIKELEETVKGSASPPRHHQRPASADNATSSEDDQPAFVPAAADGAYVESPSLHKLPTAMEKDPVPRELMTVDELLETWIK